MECTQRITRIRARRKQSSHERGIGHTPLLPQRGAARTIVIRLGHARRWHLRNAKSHGRPPRGGQLIGHRITEADHLGIEGNRAQRRHRIKHQPSLGGVTRLRGHRRGARTPCDHDARLHSIAQPLQRARGQRDGPTGEWDAESRTMCRSPQRHDLTPTTVLHRHARQPARRSGALGIHDVQQRGHRAHLRTPMPLPSSFFSCL